MKDLLLLEWKKMTKSKYLVFMFVLLILFVCIYFIYSHINAYTVEDYIDGHEQIIAGLYSQIEELENSGADDEEVVEEIEFWLEFIEIHETLAEAAKNEDWKTIIEYELGHAEDYVMTSPSQKQDNIYTWPTHFTMEAHYEKLKWMYERNIRPVFQLGEEITAYDRAFQDDEFQKIAEFFHYKTDTSSIYFLYHLLRWSLGIGGVIFFLFLFGNILTREGLSRSSSGPMNLLDTQPIPRGKVLLSKFITLLGFTLIILIAAVLFGGLLGLIFDRFGDWDYPVLVYEPDFSLHLINMGDYILQALLLFFILLVFTYSWLFFYSILLKRTFAAIMFSLLTIVLGVVWSGMEAVKENPLAAYNPFNYFQVNEVIIMEKAWEVNNYNITLGNGISSLIISSLLLFLISFLIFRRRAV